MTVPRPDVADVEARLSLLALDGIGPSRLRWLTESTDPARVVESLRQRRIPPGCGPPPPGVNPDVVARWFDTIRSIDGPALLEAELGNGHGVLTPHDDQWPFHLDPEPPALVFHRGDPELLSVSSVGVVGTRRCTTVGRTVAHQIGFDLARAGVGVISGLALGVDAAAHRGALDGGGPVIGVVASGLDVVYPGSNRTLWEEVADHGLLISEALAGTRPERWRFPARNRLIAALSSGVVIVESHRRGGSLITADEAADRGKPVFAVLGSVSNPAADGTNGLIIDGAIPVRSAADLLDAIGPTVVGGPEPSLRPEILGRFDPLDGDPLRHGASADDPRDEGDLCRRILAEIAGGPCPIDHLVLSLKSSLTELLAATYLLVASGDAIFDGGTVAPIQASSTS
jgi:DNA processing protein